MSHVSGTALGPHELLTLLRVCSANTEQLKRGGWRQLVGLSCTARSVAQQKAVYTGDGGDAIPPGDAISPGDTICNAGACGAEAFEVGVNVA